MGSLKEGGGERGKSHEEMGEEGEGKTRGRKERNENRMERKQAVLFLKL